MVDGNTHAIETSQREHGISPVLSVRGSSLEQHNDQSFASEDEALEPVDEVGLLLIDRKRSCKRSFTDE